MGNKDIILIERERIKKIVEKKIDYIIWKREQMYSGKKTHRKDKRQLIPLFERLKEDILFELTNPNYKRKNTPAPPRKRIIQLMGKGLRGLQSFAPA